MVGVCVFVLVGAGVNVEVGKDCVWMINCGGLAPSFDE